MRALIYTRISQDRSGEGEANERQEEACRQLAASRGWEVVGVEHDISISGWQKNKDRPGWNRTVERMERGECDVVVAWKLDRVTRRVRDLIDLIEIAEKTGVSFATTDGMLDLSSPTGRAVATILGAVAQMEVELKAERQQAASRARAAKGIPWKTGFRAFGYTLDGEIVEKEAALIREAAEDVLNGAPLRAIVRRWKELEIPTARSRKNVNGWTHNSVRSILLNPRNAGISTYKGEVIGKGSWEPILSEETHVLLVATLTDPARTRGDKSLGNKPRNLLSGLAKCGECGFPVEAGSSSGRKVYKCSNPSGDHITTDREGAEQIVRNALVLSIGTTTPGTVTEPRPKEVAATLWTERKTVSERLDMLATRWAEGAVTDGQFDAANRSLQKQLAAIEARIETAAQQPDDAHSLRWEEARKFDALDVWGQRRVLADLTEIKLWPKNRKRDVPMKQQVTVYVTDQRGRTWPALDERKGQAPDPSGATYEALADVLVREQPEGITTLASAAEWLADNGHTDRAPGGLPGKLSPLVRYVRGQTRGATGWTRKAMEAA